MALETIASFNRVKSLTSDLEMLRAAVRARPNELALTEDGAGVRRVRELSVDDDSADRTVHVTVSYTHLTLPTICSV